MTSTFLSATHAVILASKLLAKRRSDRQRKSPGNHISSLKRGVHNAKYVRVESNMENLAQSVREKAF